MTASKQLRALGGGELIPNVTRVEIPASLIPLISDVVERAEMNYQAQADICIERIEEFPDWLVTDGRALTALRDALERK